MNNKILILILISFSASCFSANYKNDSIQNLKNGEILFEGEINKESFDKLIKAATSSEQKITLLKINSQGGSVNYAIQIAGWIYHNKISVEVVDYCISSCANYIFPAGNKKLLHKNSLLIWHGGAFQKEFDDDSLLRTMTDEYLLNKGTQKEELESVRNQSLSNFRNDRLNEKKLYKKLRIDLNLPTHGQAENCIKNNPQENFEGFYYSIETMKSMGIKNIVLLDKLWEPSAEYYSSKNVYQAKSRVGEECENIKTSTPEILYGFISYSSINLFIQAVTSAGLDKTFPDEESSKLSRLYFDRKLQKLVFSNELKEKINTDKEFFQQQERNIYLRCKDSPIDKLLFNSLKLESYLYRFVIGEKIIKEITIHSKQCEKVQ